MIQEVLPMPPRPPQDKTHDEFPKRVKTFWDYWSHLELVSLDQTHQRSEHRSNAYIAERCSSAPATSCVEWNDNRKWRCENKFFEGDRMTLGFWTAIVASFFVLTSCGNGNPNPQTSPSSMSALPHGGSSISVVTITGEAVLVDSAEVAAGLKQLLAQPSLHLDSFTNNANGTVTLVHPWFQTLDSRMIFAGDSVHICHRYGFTFGGKISYYYEDPWFKCPEGGCEVVNLHSDDDGYFISHKFEPGSPYLDYAVAAVNCWGKLGKVEKERPVSITTMAGKRVDVNPNEIRIAFKRALENLGVTSKIFDLREGGAFELRYPKFRHKGTLIPFWWNEAKDNVPEGICKALGFTKSVSADRNLHTPIPCLGESCLGVVLTAEGNIVVSKPTDQNDPWIATKVICR
jgi:hypothetical protein